MVGKSLVQTLREVKGSIQRAAERAGRSPDDVTLIGVTKKVCAEVVQTAAGLGLLDFGESYAQEAITKKRQVANPALHWHFIGRLQSNKVKSVVGEFALIHSVDSEELALAINKRAQALNCVQSILLQVKIGDEAGKGGVEPEQLLDIAGRALSLPHLAVCGLMCIPAPTEDLDRLRKNFRTLKELRRHLDRELAQNLRLHHPLNDLSMGMSSDFEIAIEEGATMVRLGTILFGARTER